MNQFPPMIDIIRVEEDKRYGMFGILLLQGSAYCATLEPPWQMNEQNVSCIPPGGYTAIRVPSPKFGETYLLRDVPGRTSIELHPGNTVDDTHGCIILASEFGKLRSGQRAVLNSGKTFRTFLRALADHPQIIITIRAPLW